MKCMFFSFQGERKLFLHFWYGDVLLQKIKSVDENYESYYEVCELETFWSESKAKRREWVAEMKDKEIVNECKQLLSELNSDKIDSFGFFSRLQDEWNF